NLQEIINRELPSLAMPLSLNNILMGTHKEGGAVTFWSHAVSLPLSSNAILTWKFCYMVHKLLRDGHSNTLRDTYGHCPNIKQTGVLWVSKQCKYMCMYYTEIPPNLEVPDTVLDRIISVDINKVFETTLEVFDYMDAALKLEETVFGQMDSNNVSSATSVGQCRLAPLVFVIQDCGPLYHLLVKLLFKLHSRIPADALLEHREKFREHFNGLTVFFDRARQIEYFKTIIQIPDLPESPPNFLRGAALAEHVKPVVVENKLFEDEDLEQTDIPGMVYPMVQWEVDTLQKEVEAVKREAQLCVMQLRSQVNQLEAELEDQRTHKQIALVENERLRMEMDALRAHTISQTFVITAGRAQAAQLHFSRLKEKHAELVSRHADLMRKNADTVKLLATAQQGQDETVRAKQQIEHEVEKMRLENSTKFHGQNLEIDRLKRELENERAEVARIHSNLQSKEKAGDHLNSVLAGLQTEKEVLLRSVREQEAEISKLRQDAHLHQASLQQERDRSNREIATAQNQLRAKIGRDLDLQQRLQDEQFSLLQCAVVEAEGIVLDAVAKLDDPLHVRCTSSPDYLINRAETTLGSIDKMQQSHTGYLRNLDDASGLLRAVTQFSHLAADTIVNGAATSHSAPVDQADRLTENCRDCATHCLQFLKELKFKATLPRADPTAIRYVIQRILHLGQDLRPRGLDVQKEELGDMVDKEMAATSSAIEEAVLRMDEILNQARRDTSGIKLEVNQRVSNGAASVKEFYAKNSCWTEGLISAAKSVGWGATDNSADKVVSNNGKFEELIVCSHEIAASTAQLVAASKVKADRNNRKLHTLQQASRHVNDMAAVVVTSTKAGQMQFEDKDPMDFSGLSLIKLKKEEMETQVRVLELESCLEKERVHLGELRKKHYELRGATDQPAGTEDEDLANYPPPPPVLLSPEPPTNPFLARAATRAG
uniref:I/LWEQ domain-containing protein n=1 Tax=Denticeps clupeoides TaxID=299321 RepID=A0AAY4CJF4_9TELE